MTSFRVPGDPFVGKVPQVPCKSLSGVDCDRSVTPDDEHCGDPTHVLPTRDLPSMPEGVSGARVNRPRLAVVDDYVVVGVGVGDRPLDPATFDFNQTHVAQVVVDGFTLHHGVDEEVARAEVRAFARDAIAAGRHRQEADGKHLLDWRGIRVRLSADGAAILSYRTLHYERLPSEVLAGRPSRFGKRSRSRAVSRTSDDSSSDELTETEVLALISDGKARLADRVVSLYARTLGHGTALDETAELLRSRLAAAASAVTAPLPTADRGGLILSDSGTSWIIAMPTGVVVATFSSDDTE